VVLSGDDVLGYFENANILALKSIIADPIYQLPCAKMGKMLTVTAEHLLPVANTLFEYSAITDSIKQLFVDKNFSTEDIDSIMCNFHLLRSNSIIVHSFKTWICTSLNNVDDNAICIFFQVWFRNIIRAMLHCISELEQLILATDSLRSS
jgi:hypothetical protein